MKFTRIVTAVFSVALLLTMLGSCAEKLPDLNPTYSYTLQR